MEKPTFSIRMIYFKLIQFFSTKKRLHSLCLIAALFFSLNAFAQLPVPFTPRLDGGSVKVKGDITLIGNSIVTGAGFTLPYNGTTNNNALEAIYINVESGGDPTIFSSSSADLEISSTCKKIVYAGLYWASVYPYEQSTNNTAPFDGTPRIEDWNEIKFRLPTGDFIDLSADTNADPVGEEDDIIFDGFQYYGPTPQESFKDSPIICYKNVTGLLQNLTEANGKYTVANLRASRGRRNGGSSAGWTLVVIYEDPVLPSKYITTFDGYAGVQGNTILDIPVTGYQTLPAPFPVNANIGVGALEGDLGILGDSFRFKAATNTNYTALSDAVNPVSNFFNSNITLNGVNNLNRNPASTNTLGLDINNVRVPNPANNVIPNNSTAGNLRLTTSGDGYGAFLASFSVEIIEPKIVLTKIVVDDSGVDIGNQTVGLGQSLNYIIGFQNTGNDDATGFIIRDILPTNIVFNYPSDLVLPPGVTVASYDPATQEIIFNIEDYLVEQNDPIYEIRIETEVVQSCSLLSDACVNTIQNQAFATYGGSLDPSFLISDDPSFSSNTGCLTVPQATNFLADLDDCIFSQNEILCGLTVNLTAANGYDSYSWSSSPTGIPVIGTTQTITVDETGIYYVSNTAIAPCQSIAQVFNVELFGGAIQNPVIPYADEVVTCPNDGKLLPNIFLCGINDFVNIETNISGTSSIIWEQLDEASCPAVSNSDCANENTSCIWNQVQVGPDFLADTSGQFRITVNYEGGCFVQFYFNVYQNLLAPTIVSTDIICTTPGNITVNNVPVGYEYSLDGVNFQSNNTFTINTPGLYSVFIQQIGISTNPCVFTVNDILIRERDFTATATVVQPFCYGDLGSIYLAANDAEPQYFFTLFSNGTQVNSVGPIISNTYTFANLNPGTYTANISTDNGCTFSQEIIITQPDLLSTTAAITQPLTCSDGELTIYPVGGTPPYFYFVNSTVDFETVPEVVITSSGTYNITVIDANNCVATTTIIVDELPEPDFDISQTDVLCYGNSSGSIQINVNDANGYTLQFSIDNGVTFSNNSTFSNLSSGTYNVIVRYVLAGSECFTIAQPVIITQPDEALTATAGISELAGCGPNGEGTIRITNPQGGTPFPAPNFYEYSFDNQATWVTTNEAAVLPGTYTVYIRDANGCIFVMQDVILDSEPSEPTIAVSDTTFNCDGSGNATVTVTNSSGSNYSFDYYLDGVLNPNTTDPTVFTNVPTGSHTISVEYTLLTVPTFSNLLYETFGYGEDTTSPGINPTYYCFERQVPATQCNGSPAINDGDYSVTSNIQFPFGTWINPIDHTPPTIPATPNGRYLAVNIGSTIPATEVLYEKDIIDIIPNQPIQVEFAAINLVGPGSNIFDPDLLVALVDASGTEISSYNTGNIPKTGNWIEYPLTPITLDPGNNTNLKFILRSNVQQNNGNDVAIDDIRVYQLPEICTTTVDFPFIVSSGNAFAADITGTSAVSCSGAANGSITIAAQNFDTTNGFQYSTDNGITWTTQLTSPFTITGLTDGNYTILVRYEDEPDTCEFILTETITSADPLTVSATNTDVTCLDGATITATANDGTPGYTYVLIDTVSPFTETNFEGNGIITNVVPGTYTVQVTDALGCVATTEVILTAPTLPVATIDITSDLCFDNTNGATIVVDVSAGQPPYQYSINSGAFQNNNTFTNLTPGNYTVIVRDAYGCTVTLPVQTIQNQLTLNTVITKGLDCTANPDAVITGTATGGLIPYSFTVSYNGGAYTAISGSVSPFIYTTAASGTYQFQITDASGCTATSGLQTINAISLPEIISVTQTQSILCFGENTAAIDVNINNTVGTPNFTINVNNDTTGTNYGTQTSGLPAGDYTVTLTDINSCNDTATITIGQPDDIVVASSTVPITCNASGTSQGSVIVNGVTGGTAPYNYFVTGTNGYNNSELNTSGTTSVNFDVVDFGLYQINIVDANGCSVLIQDVLVASPPDDLDIDIETTADCTLGGEAVVTVSTTLVGSGPFYFDIYNGTIPPPPPGGTWQAESTPGTGSTVFTGLTTGVLYTFIVYDELTGCFYFETAQTPVPSNATLTVSAVGANNISCTGAANGNASFTITNPEANNINVTYEIFNSLSQVSTGITGTGTVNANGTLNVPNLGPLPFGNYYVLVTEDSGANSGCAVATAPFNITESAIPLNLTTAIVKNANCNTNSGVISASGQNGTPSYTYQITATATAPAPGDSAWSTTNVFNVNAGSYFVHVQDAYGCIVTSPVIILNQDAIPIVAATVSNQCTADEGNFAINVNLPTAGIAPHSFSIDGGAFQTMTATFTISNLASGTHTIEVQDANGCGNIVTVTIAPPVNLTTNVTAAVSCSDDDGEITITGFGGTGAYTYTISPTNPGITLSGNVYSGVPSGTYTVTITDNATTCSANTTVILEPATPVTFTSSAENVTCNAGNDGVITVNLPASNDNPVYTYEIIAPFAVAAQTSNVFTGLSANTYTIQVNSGKNCVATDTITITQPDEIIVAAPVVSQYECNSGNTLSYASITVTGVSGGSGTYVTYEFIENGTMVQSGNNPVYIEADSTGGSYIINVYDNEGCFGSTTTAVIINPYIDLDDVNVTVDSAITCTNLENITITATSSSGTATNLEFTVEDVLGTTTGGVYSQTNATGLFTGLDIGNYIITVTNLDTGCNLETVHYVSNPNTFDIILNNVVDVICFNDTNGSVDITFIDLVVNGTNPDQSGSFNYTVVDAAGTTVSNGVTTNAGPVTITGLPGGIYTVTATLVNNPFCTVVKNFTITRPPAELFLTATEASNVTCDDNLGSIQAVATGGWSSVYDFELVLGGVVVEAYSPNTLFTGLSAGTYTVNVRDSQGCIVSVTVTLDLPAPISATVLPNVTTLACFGDQDASITITGVIGGQGLNYTYVLNTILPTPSTSGPQTTNVFGDLGAGTYSVTITDGFNCEFTSAEIVISEPQPILASLINTSTQPCPLTYELTLSATGGTGLYTYSDTSTFATILGTFTSSTTIAVTPGTYQYYVSDANGCIAAVSNEITIDVLPQLVLSLQSSNLFINCTGDNNGSISALAQGGLGNYLYTLVDDAGATVATTTTSPAVFTELFAGTYQVNVISNNCITDTQTVIIEEPELGLQVDFNVNNITCNGNNDGILEILATGGTGIIKYAISPQLNQFFDTNIFENLPAGTYDFIVQDELGCFYTDSFTIIDPPAVIIQIVQGSIIPEICEGDADGSFNIEISGGSLPYSVALDDVNGTYITGGPTQTIFDFENLGGGDHVVFIQDAQSCPSEWNITFPESVRIDPQVTIEYLCENNTLSNIVTVSVDASVTDLSLLTYSLNGGVPQADNVFVNVDPLNGANQYIEVVHTNGCIQLTDFFTIEDYQPLTLILTEGDEPGEIIAETTGGTGSNIYTFNNENYGSENTFIVTQSGTYLVVVTDSSGCQAEAVINIEVLGPCFSNYFSPNNDNVADTWAPGCVEDFPNLTFDIFDRYGRVVAKLRVGQEWDGKYNGVELPTGDYWYLVKTNSSLLDKEYVGHFTLYR